MTRWPGLFTLSCALVSALLINAAFLSRDARAASREAAGIPSIKERPELRLAESKGAAAATNADAALEALIKDDEKKRAKVGKAAETADTGNSKPDAANAKPDGHSSLNDESLYPTAAQCGECHKQIYEEWSSSQHAYASISPMFHKFEQKFQDLTQGTVGTFCVRCHQQVGTQLGEDRATPLWERAAISREGVSCITCHRVGEQYGKVNGERRVSPGKIYDPVYGTGEKSVIDDVIAQKDKYLVKTSPDGRGM